MKKCKCSCHDEREEEHEIKEYRDGYVRWKEIYENIEKHLLMNPKKWIRHFAKDKHGDNQRKGFETSGNSEDNSIRIVIQDILDYFGLAYYNDKTLCSQKQATDIERAEKNAKTAKKKLELLRGQKHEKCL